jgi:pilus assembly protein CpaB
MALPRIPINANWLLLAAAVALGLGAAHFSNRLLERRMAELEKAAQRGTETVEVVVAQRDLERGEALSGDTMAVRSVPKEYVHDSAVRPAEFESFERQRLAAPLKRGEVLLEVHAEGNGTNVFSALLKKGSRALTFEVDSVNSISGMLRPGDRIDLMYSTRGSANGTDVTAPLLSNVTVLATDQRVSKRTDENGREHQFSTITLEVSPLDAARIIVAKSSGHLTAVLRHPDDEAPNRLKSLSVAQLLGAPAGRNGSRLVEYIVGGGAGGVAEVHRAGIALDSGQAPGPNR